jgi:hypothetical protein
LQLIIRSAISGSLMFLRDLEQPRHNTRSARRESLHKRRTSVNVRAALGRTHGDMNSSSIQSGRVRRECELRLRNLELITTTTDPSCPILQLSRVSCGARRAIINA